MVENHGILKFASTMFAALSVYSFWQGIALAVTIVSGLIAITLGGISLYDRIVYGPKVLR